MKKIKASIHKAQHVAPKGLTGIRLATDLVILKATTAIFITSDSPCTIQYSSRQVFVSHEWKLGFQS